MGEAMSIVMGWVVTPFFLTFFFGILLIFHPLLAVGYRTSFALGTLLLEVMDLLIIVTIRFVAGTKFRIRIPETLPRERPIIFVSNHQSMYDIPLFVWYLRAYKPNFVAKAELAKGLPSISIALREMGAALVNRRDQAQALKEIERLGKQVKKEGGSVVLFPEGTRARDGSMKRFKSAGFAVLLSTMPDAVIVPVAISGSWRLLSRNLLPIPFGTTVEFTVLDPLPGKFHNTKELVASVEKTIREAIGQSPTSVTPPFSDVDQPGD
jgi:1-acyl-sn-glycerol-3-phosphate acyltransferase